MSLAKRVIARLDIKGPNLVKGIHFEGLRVMGNPAEHALRYYREGADSFLYVDIVASLYGRNNLTEVVAQTAREVFVPLTVGGGIRKLDDINELLRAGADKVAINTAAVQRPELIAEAARSFGSQCVVLSVEAKHRADGGWEVLTDNGREHTGLDAVEWVKRAVDLGAGEVLVTSVDQEGTQKGFDLELVRAIGPVLGVPVIACGGAGSIEQVADAFRAGADAVAVASILHYKKESIGSLKAGLAALDLEVRPVKVTVVDYGLGNLHSVGKALAHEGGEVEMSAQPEVIAHAERLVLPGVGAFADGMRGLSERGLIGPIKSFVATGRPFLGICLGMQLLFTESEEFGRHAGLDLIPGRVVAIPPDTGVKVPHIGWNSLHRPHGVSWSDSLLESLSDGAMVYFVHSFAALPTNDRDRLADSSYGGRPVSAAVRRANVTGCQFHPEKSGPTGLLVLRSFLARSG